jgi:hypothetical protein
VAVVVLLIGVAVVASATALGTAAAALRPPILIATVRPGQTIVISSEDGTPLRRLVSGTYLFIVHDRSHADNLHITGSRVDRKTGLSFMGVVRWHVTFASGWIYHFYSDNDPANGIQLRAEFCACHL